MTNTKEQSGSSRRSKSEIRDLVCEKESIMGISHDCNGSYHVSVRESVCGNNRSIVSKLNN